MAFLQNRIVLGALAGALTAGWVDFNAFKSWKKWDDVSKYQWSTAAFRWVQGAIVGALTATGINLGGGA